MKTRMINRQDQYEEIYYVNGGIIEEIEYFPIVNGEVSHKGFRMICGDLGDVGDVIQYNPE